MKRAKWTILSLLMACCAVAQTPAVSPILVQITNKSLDKRQQETLELKVTDISATDVKGFVLRLELLDVKGKVQFVTNQMEISGGLPEKNQVLSPGQSVDVQWRIPLFGPQPYYHLSTDYVALVKDSSTLNSTISTLEDWGPDKSELSERLKGMLIGLRDERTRLRQLTDGQGAAELSSDLDSERPPPEAPPRRSEEYRIGLQTAYKLERERLHGLLHQRGIGSVVDDLELSR